MDLIVLLITVNVPPLDEGRRRRVATRGCYATAFSFLFSLFKSKRKELSDVAPWARMWSEVTTRPNAEPAQEHLPVYHVMSETVYGYGDAMNVTPLRSYRLKSWSYLVAIICRVFSANNGSTGKS